MMESSAKAKLMEHVVNGVPDEALKPLTEFRGHKNIARFRQFWNYTNAMMLAECEDVADGTRMYRTTDTGHVCGMHARELTHMSLTSFLSRLAGTPKVIGLVAGLRDYVSYLVPHPWKLMKNGPMTLSGKKKAVMRDLNREIGRSDTRCYPFAGHALKTENDLLLKIHAAVPSGLNRAIRGDLCQDLAVAVLSGEVSVENLPDAVARYMKEARKFSPKSEDELWKKRVFTSAKRADNLLSWQSQHAADYQPSVEDLADAWGCELHDH